MGFDVKLSIARVLNNQKIDSPKTHRVTIVTIKSKQYLVDVGFGAFTPHLPLELSSTKIHENYQLDKDKKNNHILKMIKENKPFTLYIFNLLDYTESDCTMGNFYSNHYPKAVFVNNLVISRKMKSKTISFRNNCYHKICEKYTNILNIRTYQHLKEILLDDFKIQISKKDCKLLFKKAEQFRIL